MDENRHEQPFFTADQPWSRASLVGNGTPPREMQPDSFLAPAPLDF